MKVPYRVIELLMEEGIVTDYADEYGEPGYHADGPILFGDWWCKRENCGYPEKYDENYGSSAGKTKLHDVMWHYPNIARNMEEQGFEAHFYDEWIVSHNSGKSKAYRTNADSYSWQSSILWTDGDFLTPDDDIEYWIEEVVNNPRRCFPSHVWSDAEIEAHGFKEYQCGFENGWHPGQTDDPEEITKLIRAEYEEQEKEVDILFKLQGVGQFDIRFCVFVREKEEDSEY